LDSELGLTLALILVLYLVLHFSLKLLTSLVEFGK
jgi:hypothetical protein